jgi:methanol--5-hydroxybenzimidazolylcobamide Co-methyltransferase
MNTAKQLKQDKTLRDLYAACDSYRSPEGFCLRYDNAYKIGEAIVAEGESTYLRSRAAGMKACELIAESAKTKNGLKLSKHESDMLNKVMTDLKALPDEESKFVDQCLKAYKDVQAFNPKNYEL